MFARHEFLTCILGQGKDSFAVYENCTIPRFMGFIYLTDTERRKLSNIELIMGDNINVYDYYGNSSLFVKDYAKLEFIGQFPVSPTLGYHTGRINFEDPIVKLHSHSWKKYEGFTHTDYYCDCGEKRDSI